MGFCPIDVLHQHFLQLEVPVVCQRCGRSTNLRKQDGVYRCRYCEEDLMEVFE